MPTGQDLSKVKLDKLIECFDESFAIDWLRCKFPSFETGSARKISIGESKGEKDYFASARLLGHITRLPEKSGDTTSNRPLVVVAVEMKGDMTERTSRAGQFAFAKRVLRDAVNTGATGLDGLPSQGIFFFHDNNGAFRLSLVTGEVEGRRFKFNEAKRQSFFVRPGAANNIIRRRFHDPIKTFGDLKEAFSVEQLTKEFYRELFNWYEWAKDSGACFPNILNAPKDSKKEKQYNHEAIIRLITRLMFTWFIRQRNLVPAVLFARDGVGGLLKKFDPDSMVEDNYYRAILQNLFFATFNTPQSGKDKLTRRWINAKTDARGNGVGLTSDYHVTTVYRYKDEFKDSDGFLAMMRKVPFLNCALFDCLDKIEPKEDGGRRMYFDGFSTKQERRAHVPNGLFFGDGEEGHMGIVTLFDQYEFTIDENEVNDGDVALDPELLGKVFENLLGAYNPETQATARNATGSFYTPREIVDYMVEESLKNYLRGKLSLDEKDSRIDELFDKSKAAEKAPTGFSHEEEKAILEALYACRIIDPACGSGAFPMGILNCMVRLLKRLDDDTGTSIREYLLKRYREDKERRDPTETEEDRQERLEELERRFAEGKMYPDYARKLYLIENCIYGVDIQPIAAQISKLRFFISLLCDQFRTSYNPESDNYGLLSLPNLEAKFVCANTLIALPDAGGELDLTTGKVGELRDELVLNRHKIFGARSTRTKEKYKAKDKEIRSQIREAVRDGLSKPDAGKIAQLERLIEQAKKRRKEVEKPEWVEVEKPVQQELFVAISVQPMLMKIDRNADKRNDIDSEIDKCKREIAKEQAKGGKDNIDAATKYADLVAGWDPFDQNASSPFFDPSWMFNIKDGFDVVIGNPPYVVVSGDDRHKDYYENNYKTARGGKKNLFRLFYEKGILLSRQKGCISYITPNTFLSGKAGGALRKFFFDNVTLWQLLEYSESDGVFENVTQAVVVSVMTHEKSTREHVVKMRTERQGNIYALQSKMEEVDSLIPQNAVVEKFFSQEKLLCDYVMGFQGEVNVSTQKNAYSIVLRPKTLPMWRGEYVGRYFNNGAPFEYCLISASKRNHYKWPRIITQQVSNQSGTHRTKCCIIPANQICGHSTNYITTCSDDVVKLYFWLGLINSTLFDYVFNFANPTNNIPIGKLVKMAVPELTADNTEPIISLVDRILAAKKADPNADTSALEKEIDALVYKLYGLTDEEIAIVEGKAGNGERGTGNGASAGAVADKSEKVGGHAGLPAEASAKEGCVTLPVRGKAHPPRKPPRDDDDEEVLE